MIRVDTPIEILNNTSPTDYLCSSKHRGQPTNDISVWIIDVEQEVECFKACYQNKWHNTITGWSFIFGSSRQLLLLGRNLKNGELRIAKFVINQRQWHGYPADLRYKPSDKPLPNILIEWYKKGYITKTIMTRIKQGQL